MKRVPAHSQSRHLKNIVSIAKIIAVVNNQNRKKIISHIRRFPVSQIRHLKTGSLISRSPEQISQSRRLNGFLFSLLDVRLRGLEV
jgi:hypothetical protein